MELLIIVPTYRVLRELNKFIFVKHINEWLTHRMLAEDEWVLNLCPPHFLPLPVTLLFSIWIRPGLSLCSKRWLSLGILSYPAGSLPLPARICRFRVQFLDTALGTWDASCPDQRIRYFWDCAHPQLVHNKQPPHVVPQMYCGTTHLRALLVSHWERSTVGNASSAEGIIGPPLLRWILPMYWLSKSSWEMGVGVRQWQCGLMFISLSTARRPGRPLYFWFFVVTAFPVTTG